jgi:hypothetical protein
MYEKPRPDLRRRIPGRSSLTWRREAARAASTGSVNGPTDRVDLDVRRAAGFVRAIFRFVAGGIAPP